MPDEKCNGWTNYPTWTVSMIINNTESLYHYFKRITRDIIASTRDETDRICNLADIIENIVEEMRPKNTCDIWTQLTTYASGKVNYREIAQAMLGDYEQDDF